MSETKFEGQLFYFINALRATSLSQINADALKIKIVEIKKDFPMETDEKYKGMLFTQRNLTLNNDRFFWFKKNFGDQQ